MPLFLTCSQCLCAQSKLMDLEEVFRLAVERSVSIQAYQTNWEAAGEALRAAKARYDQVSRAKRSTALAEHEQTHHLSQAEVPVRLAEAAVERVASSRGLFPLGESVEGFVERMLEVSVRQMYGWTVYACLFLFLLFLLYDAPIRRDLKRMPGWRALREEVARSFWRTGHKGGA